MGAGYASQFTRNTVKVGDLTIPYCKGGRGQPLLYLHGLSGWGRWESYHITFGITNLVYAPQLPGWQAHMMRLVVPGTACPLPCRSSRKKSGFVSPSVNAMISA